MIVKLTLETEHPELILDFLKKYDYLRYYPYDTSSITDDRMYHTLFKNDKRYRHLTKLPEETLDDNDNTIITTLSEDDKAWLCESIQNAWYQFTDNRTEKNYLRSQFSVTIVSSCNGSWGNGKDFYVFPTSYTEHPVLQF